MPHQTSFTVRTADDFFVQIVLPQYRDFIENNSSVRHALLSIITVYHMGEWAYQRERFRHKNGKWKTAARKAQAHEHFEIAEMITNGTKHFEPKIITTRTQTGFSSGFSDGFARPLLVRKRSGDEISADALLRELVDFWKDQKRLGVF